MPSSLTVHVLSRAPYTVQPFFARGVFDANVSVTEMLLTVSVPPLAKAPTFTLSKFSNDAIVTAPSAGSEAPLSVWAVKETGVSPAVTVTAEDFM